MSRCMLALLLLASMALADDKPSPWLGVSMGVEANVSDVGQRKFTRGIRVQDAVSGSPAEKAGLHAGDIIVSAGGVDFDQDAEGLLTRLRDAITAKQPGDVLDLEIVRDRVDHSATLDGKPIEDPSAWVDPDALLMKSPPGPRLDLHAERKRELIAFHVTLEARPQSAQSAIPPNAEILPEGVPAPPEEAFAAALRQEFGIEADYQDLLARYAKLEETGDPCRLRRFSYAHRDPFKMGPLARRAVDDLVHGRHALGIAAGATWLDHPISAEETKLAPPGRTLDERIDEIVALLGRAKAHWDKAFAATTREERDRVLKLLPTLSDSIAQGFVFAGDPKRERVAQDMEVVRIALRVDYAELYAAALEIHELLWSASDLEPDLERAWEEKGKPDGVFFSKDTPFGKILVGGKGNKWYREDAAVILDLGGDDLYTNNAGASDGDRLPFAVVIDFAGNDAYEATSDWAQGAGRLGVGAILDYDGGDSFIAQRWAQGACVMGVGMLMEIGGGNTFRGTEFVQSAALWGQAWVVAAEGQAYSSEGKTYPAGGQHTGPNRYEAGGYSQSCAMPGALSVLHDIGAEDHCYYCKGLHPTNYGDAGIFDAWGQGCGVGFRGVLSGGLALLVDDGHKSYFEAGNFSQGGGYYFGWGIFVGGPGDDRYVGSRYNQGFAAHQAMGYFEDSKGDDKYDTRQGVAQGLSWDETVVTFIGGAGRDEYHGGLFFSQGAVAHNGFCLFEDAGGKDLFDYAPGQAQADANDYHGGTSFGLFLHLGGGESVYNSQTKNNEVRLHGHYGIVCDLPGGLDIETAKNLIRK